MPALKLRGLAAAFLCALAGCSGAPSIETNQLPPPVNAPAANISVTGTQVAAAEALGHIGQPAVPVLAEALMDSDPAVRLQACRALAYMGAKAGSAVPALQRALNDPEVAVREQAAAALGQIGAAAEPAVPSLIQMLRTKPETMNDKR
jgi:hypothetical protein